MAAANEGFDEDLLPGGSFTRLLDSGDDGSFDMEGTGSFIFPMGNAPKMLCFGNPCNQGEKAFSEYGVIAQRSGMTASDSSSVSSSNHSSTGSLPNSKSQKGEAKIEQKKRNGSELGLVPSSSLVSGASGGNRKTNKKAKTENLTSASTGPGKARKEKLGERITALQQLVSPFGKTDTASVLHEAMGYIRFLHDQVQVLSSPYMQRLPVSEHGHLQEGRRKEEEEESRYNLRSRGLCLVPVECTFHMANSNGADFWSFAMASNSCNSNPKTMNPPLSSQTCTL